MAFTLVSWAISPPYSALISHLIILHYIHIMMPLLSFWTVSTPLDTTLDPCQKQKQKNSLVLSRQPHSPWFLSWESQESSTSCRTFHFHFVNQLQYPLLILLSTLTYSHVHRALHQQSVCSYGLSPQALRQPFTTWQKPTAWCPYMLPNGQAWSSEQEKTAWQLIPASVLDSWHQQGPMMKLQMLVLIYLDHKALAQYLNGWMITFLFTFYESILTVTTACMRLMLLSLHEMAICWWKKAANGIMVRACLMTGSKNLMRTFHFPFLTSQ